MKKQRLNCLLSRKNCTKQTVDIKKRRNPLKEFNHLIKISLPVLFQASVLPDLDKHLNYIEHILVHKGTEYAVRYLKATHESVEHLILGLSGKLEHEKVSIGKDQDGWPTWLGVRLKRKCLTNHLPSIRYAFTLCSARRLLTVPTTTTLKSITDAPTWTEKVDIHPILQGLGGTDRDLFREIRHPEIGSDALDTLKTTTYKVPKLQISQKSSPNGISYFSFPFDRAAIIKHGLDESLREFSKVYFRGDVDDWLDDHIEPYEELVDSNRQLHVGKISLQHETGKLKPRVFAIVDSVTQSLLGDFHQDLMSILRLIPEDCTYNQDKVTEVAKRLHETESEPFYGFADLSNVTDRLPKYLYEEIGNFARAGLGSAWVKVFERDFVVSESVKRHWDPNTRRPTHVRYQCGQPMGALSSWPFMALTHHVLVWYSFGSRKASLGKYLILGDDIVIFDKDAYSRYLEVLNTLGCSYTNGFSTVGFEFAKRLFFQGSEVTGAYTQALWATRNVPEVFTLEWSNLARRGYQVGYDLHSDFRTLLKVSRKRFEWCRQLMTVPRGTEISLHDLSHFCVQAMGRSFCLLSSRGNADSLVESVKAFRQGAALLIKQNFQKSLEDAKLAIPENIARFATEFRKSSGLGDQYSPVMQAAIEEFTTDSRTRIRYLERDLKLQYLNPTDRQLLRPHLIEVPRLIDFSQRDKAFTRLRHRAIHQRQIIQLLRG